jgi:ribosomal protein L37AE/L43A
MIITFKKYVFATDGSISKLFVRCQCPDCGYYRVTARFKRAICKKCGFEFNSTIKTMVYDINARLEFFAGDNINGSFTY